MRFKSPTKLSEAEIAAKLAKNTAARLAYIAEKKEFRVLEEQQQKRAALVRRQASLKAEGDYWRERGFAHNEDEAMNRLREHVHDDTQRIAAEAARRGYCHVKG